MKVSIFVATGETWAAKSNTILRSEAIGSCVAVAAFEKNSGIGGLAHIMLPGSSSGLPICNPKYAQDGIKDMLFKMHRLGAAQNAVEACLVGGANVLQDIKDSICFPLIRSVSEILKENEIPVVAKSLGGVLRRSVSIDIIDAQEAQVYYTLGDGAEKLLYKWSFIGRLDGKV